jgi:PIN domain nuclease of toxin-antitoxin system
MSALLLDTHIWLWYAEGTTDRLRPASVKKLDAAAAAECTLLPGRPHGNPVDRFPIATGRTQGVALATRDRDIIEYGKLGHVRVVEL